MRNWYDDPNRPVLVIGEIAQAHDGSLGTAHAYIDAVADAGADAVKFQTHIAAAESTSAEPWRVRFSPQDETRFDYWKRMEFDPSAWKGLANHAAERGLVFLSTPFSIEAADLLEDLDIAAWKVGSGEVTNRPFLSRLARTGKPILLSSGMASWAELDAAVETIRQHETPLVVLQCTTAYPCPPERVGLNVLGELRDRYGVPVGLSDHSGTIYPGLAAVALGASIVEVHVTLSRAAFGPDVPASVTTEELRELVAGIRFLEKSLAHPVRKDEAASDLAELKTLFGRSVVVARDLEAGHELVPDDLALKKPGGGMGPDQLEVLCGRVLKRALAADTPLTEDDLDD